MADVNGVLEIQLFHQLGDIGGVCVHLVTGDGLGGTPMSTTVMSDHPKSALEKEHDLGIPVIG
jgi:hypothetical protein